MSDKVLMDVKNIRVCYKTRRSFFRHDQFKALDGLSFTIRQGETLGIIGMNGCGKSTLLRVLANIYGVNSGEVIWNCKKVSLLSLTLGFDPELSGRDNAIISGMLLGGRKSEVVAKLGEIAAFSGLESFFYKPIKTYSTGMRARLGFSVAVLMQSDLLLIDEVLSVGDGKFRAKAEAAMLDRINTEQTVVLVSHNLSQVSSLCDRVLWVHRGRKKMLGGSAEVLNKYKEFLDNQSGNS